MSARTEPLSTGPCTRSGRTAPAPARSPPSVVAVPATATISRGRARSPSKYGRSSSATQPARLVDLAGGGRIGAQEQLGHAPRARRRPSATTSMSLDAHAVLDAHVAQHELGRPAADVNDEDPLALDARRSRRGTPGAPPVAPR